MPVPDEDKPTSATPPTSTANKSLSQLISDQIGCDVTMWNGKPCGRLIHHQPRPIDRTPVCLMHSRDPGKSNANFNAEFERMLAAAETSVNLAERVADFTEFVFRKAEFDKLLFKIKCVFHGATFTESADFRHAGFTQSADFDSAIFTGDANFHEAIFTESADFRHASFMQSADFDSAKFTQNANFSAATFSQAASFFDANFSQGAHFIKTTFTQSATFVDAKFKKPVNFVDARFKESARFQNARFMQSADFLFTTFTQSASFFGATFAQIADFRWAKFLGEVEFRETKFRADATREPGPIFSVAQFSHPEAVIFYKTDLSHALFLNCDVTKFNFSSVIWRKRIGIGKRMVFEEDIDVKVRDNAVGPLQPKKGDFDERDYSLIAELYQQLKKNYDDKRDYWTAGDFHYGEMEMKRLSCPRKSKFARGLHRHLGLVAWYKYASQYGESYWRPAIWLIGLLLLFAAVYPGLGLRYDGSKTVSRANLTQSSQILTYRNPLPNGEASKGPFRDNLRLYGHSLVTAIDVAAFQKDRAYEPTYPYGHVLALVELFLTSTLIALFLLAVQRQFRR